MDAKDLMVGDILLYNGNPMEVTIVNNDGGVVAKSVSKNLPPVLTSVYEFEPIPLTEEILIKNGWEKHPMPFLTEWYGRIALCEQKGRFFFTSIELNYVHQLQNLLRMCNMAKTIKL